MRTIEDILQELQEDGSVKITMDEWYRYKNHLKSFYSDYEYSSTEIAIPGMEICKSVEPLGPWTGGITSVQPISLTDWYNSQPVLSDEMKREITKHINEEVANGNIKL